MTDGVISHHFASFKSLVDLVLLDLPINFYRTEDSKQERERSTEEVEDLKQQLSKAAADTLRNGK